MKKLYIISTILLLSFSVFNANAQRTEVTLYTSNGDITIELWDSLAPVTVDSFIARTVRGFYDGTIFHRVWDNFMIQGGSPDGTGNGGTGTTIPDEFHPSLKNIPGALSMANLGTAHTGDCQFFINLVTNSHLDSLHTVFGKVTKNFSVVQAIGKVPVDANKRPLTEVKLDSVRVTKWPASVPEVKEKYVMNIYPNPTNGVFMMQLPDEKTKVTVTDLRGTTIFEVETEQPTTLSVDLSNKPRGVYIVRVTNYESVAYRQVVLQ